MNTRQATKRIIFLLALLTLITACSPSELPVSTSTPNPPTASPVPQPTRTPAPTPIPPTATITQRPICFETAGHVESGTLTSTQPSQEYFIYLPPCYEDETEKRYPVLYLLHGQTYTADQWIRLGAVNTLDQLITSGTAQPFIMVFPDDRFWNLEAGPGFGGRLVDGLVPYIDQTYRTLADREHRAIGGMSRGAGWALRLGLSRWDLFSIIGLHSLAVFQTDGSQVERWLKDIPASAYPTIFMDIGDNDQELVKAQKVETLFNSYGLTHEWHLYSGAHTEEYWSAHVQEYMEWYAGQWPKP